MAWYLTREWVLLKPEALGKELKLLELGPQIAVLLHVPLNTMMTIHNSPKCLWTLSPTHSLSPLSPCFQCKTIIYYHTYDINITFSLSPPCLPFCVRCLSVGRSVGLGCLSELSVYELSVWECVWKPLFLSLSSVKQRPYVLTYIHTSLLLVPKL